jgi:hypothetical protein
MGILPRHDLSRHLELKTGYETVHFQDVVKTLYWSQGLAVMMPRRRDSLKRALPRAARKPSA